ncbi:hypothetical protein CFREI_03420 [Corynebacterium freiburgense]|nr:hypothetical protein CFREI_03420 [Corynebacterium freiburgense]
MHQGICWENGIRSSSLFWAGLFIGPGLWMLFPFWGIVLGLGDGPMIILFFLLAVACVIVVSAGTWNGRRKWGSAAGITYGTVIGVTLPWAVWVSPTMNEQVFFHQLCTMVCLTLSGLTLIAMLTVHFRIARRK